MIAHQTPNQIIEKLQALPLEWMLSSYPDKEIELLYQLYLPLWLPYMNYPISVKVAGWVFHMDGSTLKGATDILKRPLEDMPLLINEFDDERLAFVKWRLMIGR